MSIAPKPSEFQVHSTIVDWLRIAVPGAIVVHITNNPRSAIAGAMAKRLGMTKGAADLLFIHRGVVAFLEVKSAKGRQSKAQIEFQDRCVENMVPYAVVRGVGDVQAFLTDLGVPVRCTA